MYDYERDHLDKVRAGLGECMVLLRKNGAFPLAGACRIAAYGSGIRHSVKGGTGSGDVNSHTITNIEDGLRNAGFSLTSNKWLKRYDRIRRKAKKSFGSQLRRDAFTSGENLVMSAMGAVMPEPEYDIPLDFTADAAVYVLSRTSGEGGDRRAVAGDVFLTESEIRDIRTLDKKYEKFMLVLNTGGPVDLTPVRDVSNILVLSQLGSEMGNGLADVLLGKQVPSGKLTATWSAWKDYCSDIHMGECDETFYYEGVYVGYRYFDTVGRKALFPFGFGLSYTDFDIDAAEVTAEGMMVTVKAKIKNTGDFFGKEVMQVYVTAPEVRLKKPWQELAGFAKTGIIPAGGSEEVIVSFDIRDLASFDEMSHEYVLEPGEYVVRAGNSSVSTEAVAVLVLDEEVSVRRVKPVIPRADFEEKQYERKAAVEYPPETVRILLDAGAFKTTDTECGSEYSCRGKSGAYAIDPLIKELSNKELAYLAVGRFSEKMGLASIIGSASQAVAGAAGETTAALKDLGIRPVIMADGPAGLRLSKEYYEDKSGAHTIGNAVISDDILELMGHTLGKIMTAATGRKRAPKGAEVKTQYCTAIPVGTAVAQSWNTDYARELGDIVGSEMELFGVDLWLAPALNIHRSIVCGRNFEYYSEDPLVSGKIAAAITAGVQSHPGKGATIKHFAANNQELNRYYNNSNISERALREIYMKGFAICICEAAPLALMTSYNLINGVHSSECRGMIEGFLRAENGFEGIVMTDWVTKIKNLGSEYRIARADKVAAAGGDLFMPGSRRDHKAVTKALNDGSLSREQVEINASRVCRLARKLDEAAGADAKMH